MTRIRVALDSDSDQLITLIGDAFAEYEGCLLDVENEIPELLNIASHYKKKNGNFWVAEKEKEIIGCIGIQTLKDSAELVKLYLNKNHRGQGLAERLCNLVFDEARSKGCSNIELYTDTRFNRAHSFYERLGFVKGSHIRTLNDISNTKEFHYQMDLSAAQHN